METQKRIASSEIIGKLYGDTDDLQKILQEHTQIITDRYSGRHTLKEYFSEIPRRVICICPMVLCKTLLHDIGINAPRNLLGGIGMAMYSISTHDDVVDEKPATQEVVAGLIYSGNIATLYGLNLLNTTGYAAIAEKITHLINLNHCFQTDIVFSLWKQPSDEAGYLSAIKHTGYWASIGMIAATTYSKRPDLEVFAEKFGHLYGRMCQVYDDAREIEDDLRNGYHSLPISISLKYNYCLSDPNDRLKATQRSKEIAQSCFKEISELCKDNYPALLDLASRMHVIGSSL